MFVKDMKSKRVRLGYGLRKAGVSRATFYRKMSGHPLAPLQDGADGLHFAAQTWIACSRDQRS